MSKTTVKSNPQPKPNSSRETIIIKQGQTEEREYVPKQPSGSPAKSTR